MLAIQILYDILLRLFVDGRHLRNIALLVDSTALLNNTRVLTVDVDVDDVVFVELSGPPLRNSILHLVLQFDAVGTFREGLSDGLLVKFVEFVVELGDHLLDVMRLLFLVQLVDNSLLDVSLSVALDDRASGADHLLLPDLRGDGVLSQDGFDARIFIMLEHVDVSIVNIVDGSFVDLGHGPDSKWPFGGIVVDAWVGECVRRLVVLRNIGRLDHMLRHLAYIDDLIGVVGLTFAVECIDSSATHLLLPHGLNEWRRGGSRIFQVVNHRLTLSFRGVLDLTVRILKAVRSASVVQHIFLDIVDMLFVE